VGDIVSFENKGQKEKIEEWKQKKGLKSNSAAIRDMINYAYMGLEKERVYDKPGWGRPDLFEKLNLRIFGGGETGKDPYLATMDKEDGQLGMGEEFHTTDELLEFVINETNLDEEKAEKEINDAFEWLKEKRTEVREELDEAKREANRERFSIPDDTCHICGKQSYSFGEDLNYLAQHIQRTGGRHKEFLKEHELEKEDRREELNAIERWLTENRCESSKMQELNFHRD
jgi:hypothetical protein